MSFVVDNSVAQAWCFEDEQTEAIMSLLDRVCDEGANAPQLWPIEALNGLLMAERRKRIDSVLRRRLTGFLQALPIEIDTETAGLTWTEIAELAERHRLTSYGRDLPGARPSIGLAASNDRQGPGRGCSVGWRVSPLERLESP